MRTQIDLNDNWHFSLEEEQPIPFTASQIDFDEEGWQHVNLPHDLSVAGEFDATRVRKTNMVICGRSWLVPQNV